MSGVAMMRLLALKKPPSTAGLGRTRYHETFLTSPSIASLINKQVEGCSPQNGAVRYQSTATEPGRSSNGDKCHDRKIEKLKGSESDTPHLLTQQLNPRLSGSLAAKLRHTGTVASDTDSPRALRTDEPLITRDETKGRVFELIPKDALSGVFNALEMNGVAKERYWSKIPRWKDVTEQQFLSYQWQTTNNIQRESKLLDFLESVLPAEIPLGHGTGAILGREDFLLEIVKGMKAAPMAIRLTPHILSVVDWSNPIVDPIRRQFIPFQLSSLPDHPRLTLDPLSEERDSPVEGFVHRYRDKGLFLAISVCPVLCRFCTRSYGIGADTETVTKHSQKPTKARWEKVFEYIENTPVLNDIVVSGGDCFYLQPQQLFDIGKRLLAIPHIRRFRFATKGLAVCPSRFLDPTDAWFDALIALSDKGKEVGKEVSLHTHFNHPNEMTWIGKAAALRLFQAGVRTRNQSVLLKGVNDDLATMSSLIRLLADNNIDPYYVYQGDMVKGVEDLRTPLRTILDLERQIRGSIAGHKIPSFVVDLPGGGGKRLAASYQTYDKKTGRSTFIAPAVHGEGKENKIYEYHDPIWSLPAAQHV